ncbi:hypothetical protein [Promicromonospora sp. NFX87]|uniref:hypothetical protein n=1 Tax=Promicromonospora sp. NFX87 TaxID=3402691 RepID=UPI003AFACC33
MTERPLATPTAVTRTVVATTYDLICPDDLGPTETNTFVPRRLEVKVFEGGTVFATLTGRMAADRGAPHGEDLVQTWVDGPTDSGLPRTVTSAPDWVRKAVQSATAAVPAGPA